MNARLDLICDFLNSTQGLDKLYRLLSYFSKLLAAIVVSDKNKSLVRLGRNISHTRTVMRLVGLLHNFRLSKEFDWSVSGFGDWKSFKALTRILTNYTYLPCDHLAFFGREEIVHFRPETIDLFSRTSAQSWLVGLLVEIVDLWKNLKFLIWKFNGNLQMGRLGLRGSLKVLREESKPMAAKAFLILGDFPLAVNYSLKEPFMSPLMIGICGTTSSLAALYLRWSSFRHDSQKKASSKD